MIILLTALVIFCGIAFLWYVDYKINEHKRLNQELNDILRNRRYRRQVYEKMKEKDNANVK